MTVHDNPVKRIMVVRRIGGKRVVEVPGTAGVRKKLKRLSVPAPKTGTIFLFALSKWALLTRHPYRGGLAIKLQRPRRLIKEEGI
jgi:hypothetical protein